MSLHLALGPGIPAEVHLLRPPPACCGEGEQMRSGNVFLPRSGTDQCDVLLQNCSLFSGSLLFWKAGKGGGVVARTMYEAALRGHIWPCCHSGK